MLLLQYFQLAERSAVKSGPYVSYAIGIDVNTSFSDNVQLHEGIKGQTGRIRNGRVATVGGEIKDGWKK